MSHDTDVLNRLIARLRSAAAGYRRAGADGAGLADVFGAAADTHDRTANRLATEVGALGGRTPEGGPDLGRHSWADLPGAVGKGEAAVAEGIERIEAELLGEFQAARDDPATSGPIRDVIVRTLDEVKSGHDRALQRLDALGG